MNLRIDDIQAIVAQMMAAVMVVIAVFWFINLIRINRKVELKVADPELGELTFYNSKYEEFSYWEGSQAPFGKEGMIEVLLSGNKSGIYPNVRNTYMEVKKNYERYKAMCGPVVSKWCEVHRKSLIAMQLPLMEKNFDQYFKLGAVAVEDKFSGPGDFCISYESRTRFRMYIDIYFVRGTPDSDECNVFEGD